MFFKDKKTGDSSEEWHAGEWSDVKDVNFPGWLKQYVVYTLRESVFDHVWKITAMRKFGHYLLLLTSRSLASHSWVAYNAAYLNSY